MATITEIIAEVKSRYKVYDLAGLIDDLSIINWYREVMKKFGNPLMQEAETIIEVSNSKGKFPQNFFAFKAALQIQPLGYEVESHYMPQLQQSATWIETIGLGQKWNECDPCCKTEGFEIITQNLYFGHPKCPVKFHYHRPTWLFPTKGVVKKLCDSFYENYTGGTKEDQIVISELTFYTKFREGDVYLRYWQFPTDEDGEMLVPDTKRGYLEQYLMYYIDMKVYENLLRNGDDPNIVNKLQFFSSKESEYYIKARNDVKGLTPRDMQKFLQANQLNVFRYELMYPQI